jgi:hypothetical protein
MSQPQAVLLVGCIIMILLAVLHYLLVKSATAWLWADIVVTAEAARILQRM